MASDKKICPKCGKECDIGDLYCTCNYKFSFDGNDTTSSTPEDKSGYTEQLKKRVDDYSTQYHQYDSDPPPSPYDNSNDYDEPAPDGSGCAVVIFIIIVVVIVCALFGVFDSNNSSNNNSSYTYNQQNEESTNNEDDYPSCDADTTLKPMKKDRMDALVSVFENSKYLLNAKYSLWYRNTQSEGGGYCKSEEMIKNLFWSDPDVYIALPISYRVYYENGNTMIEHQNYSDMDEIIKKGTFYKGNHQLNNSEVNALLRRNLPKNSSYNYDDESNNNYYNNTPTPTPKPKKQEYNGSHTYNKLSKPPQYQTPRYQPQASKPQPPKAKTDMEKSADSFFE